MKKNNSFYDYSPEELKDCLKETARLWKRPVTALDVSICEKLFLDYGLDADTVKYLLGFSYKRGAGTLKYMIPLAEILKAKGISSCTEAELTLEKSFKKYMDILVYINKSKAAPSLAEKEKIDEILEKYHPSQEEIRSAGEITRMSRRPSLQYFEAVLRNRQEKRKAAVPETHLKSSDSDEAVQVLSFPEDFEKIKRGVREEADLSEVAYNTWIRDLQPAENTDNRIEICIPGSDDRFLHFVEKKYKGYFETVCRRYGMEKEIFLTMKN